MNSRGTGPTVVVAVVSWNTSELLRRCLDSLAPAAASGLAEVWVVDNASTDGSAEIVRDTYDWVRLVASQENLGYGTAVNLVADQTFSSWLALANADTALTPGSLEAMLAAGGSDPRAGIIAPRLRLPDGSTQHSVWTFPTLAATVAYNLGPRLLPRRLAERLVMRGAWDPDRARRVPWAIGALLLVRRNAWTAVGGFDQAQWMSAEDLDLGWRMRQAGWATRYEPTALVDHYGSASTGAVWGEELPLHWQKCAYAWMVRRRGRALTAIVGLLNFGGSSARLVADLLLAGFRPDDRLRAWAKWTLVHRYALAPRRTLDRYR